MNRLTKKMKHYCDTDIDFDYKFADEDVCVGEIVDKLGQLEDLEEELGCPLEIREKALQQDEIFYVERNQTKMIRVVAMNCGYVNNGECVLNCLANSIWFCLPVKDYKKTWWLKKDKSE